MLMKSATLEGVAAGRITLQFRRWKRSTVKAGGTLLTPVGQLAIREVRPVTLGSITEGDARAAGFDTLADLLAALEPRSGAPAAEVFRVDLGLAGPDPRLALRETPPTREEVADIRARLNRWDDRSPVGPWTHTALAAIDGAPGVRAGDLAETIGLELARFKINVRKLKGLGLTESLEVGYRLSPRGRAVLSSVARPAPGRAR